MLNKFRDSGEKCGVYQRDTIVDVGEASGDSRNRGMDKIINRVKSVDNNKQEHSSYYITVNNVLPTNEVEFDLLQHYNQQGELQGKLPSNQNIGISNKHLYSNHKVSVITSESQRVKIHDIEYVCTNNTNSTFNIGPMGPGDKVLQHKRGIGVRKENFGDEFKVDFTNWHFIDQQTDNPIYIVAIHNLGNKGVKFYYFYLNHDTNATLYRCENIPEGNLQIIASSWWCIKVNQCLSYEMSDNLSVLQTDREVAYDNYLKDAVVQEYFKLPYVRYMQCILDYLIAKQSGDNNTKVNKIIDSCTETNTPVTPVNNTSESNIEWLGVV